MATGIGLAIPAAEATMLGCRFCYDGSYDPASTTPPAEEATWSRGISVLPIVPNNDNGIATAGVANLTDGSTTQNIYIQEPFTAANTPFSSNQANDEYTFSFRIKLSSTGASQSGSTAPLFVGFRDEYNGTGNGKAVILGFYCGASGNAAGVGFAEPNLIANQTSVSTANPFDNSWHVYTVHKYADFGGQTQVQVSIDGAVKKTVPYSSLPAAIASNNGFGYFSTVSGTSIASLDYLRLEPRMAWAHYVGWGSDFTGHYVPPAPLFYRFLDQPLLGSLVNDTVHWVDAPNLSMEINAALANGIDGFAVDIVKFIATQDEYKLDDLYSAAAGTSFHIAPCIDQFDTVANSVAAVTGYLQAHGSSPNTCRINGKPVIFIYSIGGRTLADCQAIVAGVRSNGYDACWLYNPTTNVIGHASGDPDWNDSTGIQQFLGCFDGLYDFGLYDEESVMADKLARGRSDLAAVSKPDGILSAGIVQGYVGVLNPFYNAFHGTGTTRDSWEAAGDPDVDADWVSYTTWNDYSENTHVSPSFWERDTLLLLNRDHARSWRGEPLQGVGVPSRPVPVYFSYMPEIRLGDDWPIEVLAGPCPPSISKACYVKLTTLDGTTTLQSYGPVAVPSLAEGATQLRFATPGLTAANQRRFCVWAAVTNGGTPAASDWRQLYPVTVRAGTNLNLRTLHVAFNELQPSPTLAMTASGNTLSFTTSAPSAFTGTAELLCDGRLVQSQSVTSSSSVTFSGVVRQKLQPVDLYVVRLGTTTTPYSYAYSNPVLDDSFTGGDTPATVSISTRANGDWDDSSGATPGTASVSLSPSETYGFLFPMNTGATSQIPDAGPWHVVALGGAGMWGKASGLPPTAASEAAANGTLSYLHFGGGAQVVAQTRAFPIDVFTAEAVVRAGTQTGEVSILSDMNSALNLGIDATGHLFAERVDASNTLRRIAATGAFPSGEWIHVACTYDGNHLTLYQDGEQVGQETIGLSIKQINSLFGMGCKVGFTFVYSNRFVGDLAGVSVQAAALTPDDFLLHAEAVYEAESVAATASATLSTINEELASGGKTVKMASTAVGQWASFPINVSTAGTYDVRARFKCGSTRGKFQLSIDGTNLGVIQDFYDSGTRWEEIDFGPKTLSAGIHAFKFTVTGKDSVSGSYDFDIDYLALKP